MKFPKRVSCRTLNECKSCFKNKKEKISILKTKFEVPCYHLCFG